MKDVERSGCDCSPEIKIKSNAKGLEIALVPNSFALLELTLAAIMMER